MSSEIIPTPADLLLSTRVRTVPRVREPMLHRRLDNLKAMARSLLTELESLGRPDAPEPNGKLNLDDELKRYEIGLIRAALDKADGSQTRAARMLGVKVTTLNTKIQTLPVRVEATTSAAIQTWAVGFTARRNGPAHMNVPASEDTRHETHERFE